MARPMHPEDVRKRNIEWTLGPLPPLPELMAPSVPGPIRFRDFDGTEHIGADAVATPEWRWAEKGADGAHSVRSARLELLLSWPEFGEPLEREVAKLEATLDRAFNLGRSADTQPVLTGDGQIHRSYAAGVQQAKRPLVSDAEVTELIEDLKRMKANAPASACKDCRACASIPGDDCCKDCKKAYHAQQAFAHFLREFGYHAREWTDQQTGERKVRLRFRESGMYKWLALTLEQASRLDLYHREAYACCGIHKPLSLSAVKNVCASDAQPYACCGIHKPLSLSAVKNVRASDAQPGRSKLTPREVQRLIKEYNQGEV